MDAVVLHRVGFLAYFCPKQGQDFKPSAAPLYPKMGQVPPPPLRGTQGLLLDGKLRVFKARLQMLLARMYFVKVSGCSIN